ncbi:ricin B lectin (RBL4a) [Vairimorpha necatrix]|uniref:Ricin B lectin (RBL4a) n=1 Tax=Vairimorpha necatrix TaxID=6039 RepID=A0AAX4JF87_9MICR
MYSFIIQFFFKYADLTEVVFTNIKSNLSLCSKDGNDIYGCSDKEDIIKAIIKHEADNKSFIEVPKYNKVFDVAGSGSKLILYAKHGGANQIFEPVLFEQEKFMIRNNTKCFGYDKDTNSFMKAPCFDVGSMFKLAFDSDENDKGPKNENEHSSSVVEEYWPHKPKYSLHDKHIHRGRHYIHSH